MPQDDGRRISPREGLVPHDVTYDGHSLFYQPTLAEIFIPYGDSCAPYSWKEAFDLGNNGAGVKANNISLVSSCEM